MGIQGSEAEEETDEAVANYSLEEWKRYNPLTNTS